MSINFAEVLSAASRLRKTIKNTTGCLTCVKANEGDESVVIEVARKIASSNFARIIMLVELTARNGSTRISPGQGYRFDSSRLSVDSGYLRDKKTEQFSELVQLCFQKLKENTGRGFNVVPITDFSQSNRNE